VDIFHAQSAAAAASATGAGGGRHAPPLLRQLLESGEVEAGLPAGAARWVQLVFHPRCLNLRNLAWHGFLSPEDFPVHLLALLALLLPSLPPAPPRPLLLIRAPALDDTAPPPPPCAPGAALAAFVRQAGCGPAPPCPQHAPARTPAPCEGPFHTSPCARDQEEQEEKEG
jgi:hypothetical protein